jgi:transcriptional regulator with XRE-family HTH domain
VRSRKFASGGYCDFIVGWARAELAENCNTSPGYIAEIEMGRKFPSTEVIERIAEALRIEPYRLFKSNTETGGHPDAEKVYPLLPKIMKDEMQNQIRASISEIFDKY